MPVEVLLGLSTLTPHVSLTLLDCPEGEGPISFEAAAVFLRGPPDPIECVRNFT